MNMVHYLCALRARLGIKPKTKERSRYRPRLEMLEDRLAPAVLTVTSALDTVAADGVLTLREAILSTNTDSDANADATANRVGGYLTLSNDTINFNIPGGGVQTINVTGSALPALLRRVTINGASQPGFAAGGFVPLIEVSGTSAGLSANGLKMTASNSEIRSLVINNFALNGILALGSNGKIDGCYIGTDNTGLLAAPNTTGIKVAGNASNVIIGANSGTTSRNLISGNKQHGVHIVGAFTKSNLVQGNFIGPDVTGLADLGNGLDGVLLSGGTTLNIIGGAKDRVFNVISGNGSDGIEITGAGTNGNQVIGNRIGTTVAGDAALGNELDGVRIGGGASKNLVGGTALVFTVVSPTPIHKSRNIISGNGIHGVEILGAGTQRNVVEGNFIGTDVTGTADLGNLGDGVRIVGGPFNNRIGGTVVVSANPTSPQFSASGNVISGNNGHGVKIDAANANVLQANLIGTNAAGNAALGNTDDGVFVTGGALNNVIGGPIARGGNVISANTNGVVIDGAGTNGNKVQSNYIGANKAGTGGLGNTLDGVLIRAGARNNFVGGAGSILGNLIADNDSDGVEINGAGTMANEIWGNFIGTDKSGLLALGNASHGVNIVNGASRNNVGGIPAARGNLLSGNNGGGVNIANLGSTDNKVIGNFIGVDKLGTGPLANGSGVLISDNANNNTVGGPTAAAGNVISGNLFSGVNVRGANANSIDNNFIGTNALGTAAVANGNSGINIWAAAGANVASRNLISGNAQFGVIMFGSATDGNRLVGNFIGLKAGGVVPLGNGSHGVFINTDAANNRVGGTAPGEGNRIAHNGGDGVLVGSEVGWGPAGIGNSILSNSIFSNAGQGIDLGPNNGLNIDDPGDGDGGPNEMINRPVIDSAVLTGTGFLDITGYIDTLPGSMLRIEFFYNLAPNQNQGQFLIGIIPSVTVDGTGIYSLSTSLPVSASVTTAGKLTATITNLVTGSTSEFSLPCDID